MDENVYLKTVNFGGFDKKEVLAYIDKLYSEIYTLRDEVKEKDDVIASMEGGSVQDFGGREELEAKIDEAKSKVSELQASNDTLKLQVANFESDVTEKDQKISDLQNEIEDLKEKLENAEANGGGTGGDFDLGSVFIEAKKTADKVVVEAKKAAKKMEDDARELQNQILEDANNQASNIVSSAQEKADATISEANAQAESTLENARNEASVIREESADLRSSVLAEYTALDENITKLSETLRELFGDNMVKIDTAKELVEQGLGLVDGDENFNSRKKGSGAATVVKKKSDKSDKTEKVQEIAAEEEAPESSDEHTGGHSSSDVQTAQEYLARLQQEAEEQAAEEARLAEEQEQARLAAEAEAKAKEEAAQPRKTSYSKSFDLEMLSALSKEIEAQGDGEEGGLSDEEFMELWKKNS